jgi:hypothetical protein
MIEERDYAISSTNLNIYWWITIDPRVQFNQKVGYKSTSTFSSYY